MLFILYKLASNRVISVISSNIYNALKNDKIIPKLSSNENSGSFQLYFRVIVIKKLMSTKKAPDSNFPLLKLFARELFS